MLMDKPKVTVLFADIFNSTRFLTQLVSMTRSTMGFRNPLLSCFVIVAAVTFAESLVFLNEKEALMWTNTPICLAEYNETARAVNYPRILGLDSMTEELSTWKGWTEPVYRDGNTNPSKEKVVYPSVLLVMDYHEYGPGFDEHSKWHPGQMLMYALAFWNSVRTALQDIHNPRVVVQMSGIIMTDSRAASPYLNRNEGANTYAWALNRMLKYFTSNSIKSDLTKAFYIHPAKFDIVVHMTDIYPFDEPSDPYDYSEQPQTPVFVAASQGPVCSLQDQVAGIVVKDDMNFDGVSRVVDAMRKVLLPKNPNVADFLAQTTCMSAPKDRNRGREPFPPISTGQLAHNWAECQIPGYDKPDAWNCYNSTSYSSLSPLVDPRVIRCDYRGPELEAAGYGHC